MTVTEIDSEHDPRYADCTICPRNCRIDRTRGDRGFCGETSACRVAPAAPHFGEEPVFSGTRGSGTIFFSGCGCGCFFCQNAQISLHHAGRPMCDRDLHAAATALIERGVHNLNFVTPDHFLPHIERLCRTLRDDGVTLPFICNCSGYARPETVTRLAEVIDIFLPDFKFADPELAHRCMRDRHYPELALTAITRMVELKGLLRPWDPAGRRTAQRGVLVRHLVLPGHPENSIAALRRLHDRCGPDLPISVMSQFRPTAECRARNELTGTVPAAEYARVCDTVTDLGFERAFVQPDFGDEGFFPDFDRDEPFRGNETIENPSSRQAR